MKWPLIGYEMMPEMAIIDADNMMKLPPEPPRPPAMTC